ncbi:dual specificity calcium/calmodulin-dependent 3',5'-cyclic nucleotide phosphodiesterase 1A isoform 11 [Homo sapiens]|uniref:dual specificity calcium/calmodulin-dependent 3',5'-cyclic nucleotide phosphodiesterase 1A isoform 11 n=1 Tax=Homo sapiens TaxID=9606 RepID=UPI001C0EF312|nr:dual specificity calcium/calmodulin-dependent 3',5'-cyclic nucleotide phosphodiesterase 1A isoform 11 [Homo sapiens]
MGKKINKLFCFNFLVQCFRGKSKPSKCQIRKKVKNHIERLLDTEDELSDIQTDSVPSEVRDWLASTFTRKMGMTKKKPEEKPKFRSIVHAVQAGIFVERMYRKTYHMVGLAYPAAVIVTLKDVDKWSFDVFALNEASGEHSLKFMIYELFTRYDLINRFKIPVSCLITFAEALEVGYSKYKNPYHNLIHAADVTQTVHYIMLHTGIMHWLTELEILAMVFAAAIHDYEHTGTTNNFHIQTRSDVAILYNDRSVLENHHVSAAYRLMQEEEMNILINLSKDDWRDLRNLVIEMVLSTDMSGHFQQIKNIRNSLQQPEGIDRAKTMSLILHAADISHPAKSWKLHYRWTMALMEEFFLQVPLSHSVQMFLEIVTVHISVHLFCMESRACDLLLSTGHLHILGGFSKIY